MKILGIDPGTATTGYGLLCVEKDNFSLLDFGWVETNKNDSLQERLILIHRRILSLIKNHKPDVLVIERLFFASNAKTAMAVSEATGVIRLAAAKNKIPVVEYVPMQVKMEICGNGKANKKEVKKQIRKILSIRSPNHKKSHFDDVCDALAVAICHARKGMIKSKEEKERR